MYVQIHYCTNSVNETLAELVYIHNTFDHFSQVERAFSQTKRLITKRESLSLRSLTGLRVGREHIKTFGNANSVDITPSLLASHVNSRNKYRDRLEKEKREKISREKDAKQERENFLKRRKEEEDKKDYESKKKKFEDEEKTLRDGLKFDKVQLSEIDQRIEKSQIVAEIHSSMALRRKLVENINEKQNKLDSVCQQKYKMVANRAEHKK